MKTVQILKPQPQISLEKSVIKERRVGRRQKLSTEDLIHAVKLYATTSPTELSKRLNVARQTIYRKMKLVPNETIVQIFKDLKDSDLKPYQMTYEGFSTIPEFEIFQKALERREISKPYKSRLLRVLWNISVYLKKHPRNLSIEECADFLILLKQKKIEGLNHQSVKQTMRSWFQNVYAVNGDVLTSKGIDGSLSIELGKRAHDRLIEKERHLFIEALKELVENDSLFDVWITLPYFLYYTATRITASLKARIENIEKHESYWIIKVVDNGKHKNGRKTWRKFIVGELKERLERNLASRGDPESGRLFPLPYNRLLDIFKETYERAGIPIPKQPCHIWRHTSAQDFLDATDWNYELCAQTLGWDDTRILRKCYGSMSEDTKEKALRKAMGMPIKETKKEFKF